MNHYQMGGNGQGYEHRTNTNFPFDWKAEATANIIIRIDCENYCLFGLSTSSYYRRGWNRITNK